jgi:hypothetical protein
LVATVSPERTSPVADAAAARWGLPPGAVRYVRTSATCVFATGDGYLRLHPAAERPVEDIRAVAAATAALAAAGAPVAAPRASRSGRLVESIGTPGVHATLVAAAPGEARELDELSAADAQRWGRAVAQVHLVGRSVDRRGLPAWPDLVRAAVDPCGDAQSADLTDGRLRNCLAELVPRARSCTVTRSRTTPAGLPAAARSCTTSRTRACPGRPPSWPWPYGTRNRSTRWTLR